MKKILSTLASGMNALLLLALSSFVSLSYALPFTITPIGDLPTGEIQGKSVAAAYTVVNNTSRLLNNLFANLPPYVSVASGGCGSLFNLASGASCTLNLSITGPVNGQDPNPNNHLYVCLPGGTSCAGTNSPLNVQVLPTPLFSYIGSNMTGGINVCKVSMDTGDLTSCSATGNNVFLNPSSLAFSLSGQQAYVTDSGQNPAQVWLCSLNTVTGTLSNCKNSGATGITAPVGIVLNAKGTQAYIIDSSNFNVELCNVDLRSGILSGCADSGAGSIFKVPYGIALNSANTVAYIAYSNNGSGSVAWCTVSSSGQLSNCSSLGGFKQPFGIVLASSVSFAYLTDFQDNKVYLCSVNGTTGALSNCLKTGTSGSYAFSKPAGITLSSSRGQPTQIYVVNQGNGTNGKVSLCNYCAINCDDSAQTPGELICTDSAGATGLSSIVGITLS